MTYNKLHNEIIPTTFLKQPLALPGSAKYDELGAKPRSCPALFSLADRLTGWWPVFVHSHSSCVETIKCNHTGLFWGGAHIMRSEGVGTLPKNTFI